jgi:hypothetical protein
MPVTSMQPQGSTSNTAARWRPKRKAAAYITCRKLGIDRDRDTCQAFSPAYIAGWIAQKGADFQTALGRAVKAADIILDGDWPGHDEKRSGL